MKKDEQKNPQDILKLSNVALPFKLHPYESFPNS